MTSSDHRLDIRCRNRADGGAAPLTPTRALHLRHNLDTSGLFDDAALVELLDNYPVGDVHVTTMDVDSAPGRPASGWRVGTTDGLSGEQVLRAVQKGQLWLNIKRLDRNAPVYRALLGSLYAELAQCLNCPIPTWQSATLLVSSPRACVYYHADAVPNILWHVRGQKQVFLYPNHDTRFASHAELEKICSGDHDEQLPYRAQFEADATVIDLTPGQALLWPQHSPHRVDNTQGLNVSLSTEHITPAARNVVNLYRANRLLRRLGVEPNLPDPASLLGRSKRALALCHRGAQKLLRRGPIRFELTPTFRVDPDAASGYREL